MPTPVAPVLKHHTWRHLLRAFTDAHPKLRSLPSAGLTMLLAPAASAAWWLAKYAPAELLAQKELQLLVPGAGILECRDSGRWFSFVPWLLGRPELQVHVTLVGDELSAGKDGPRPSAKLSKAQLAKEWATPISSVVASRPESTIFNGTLANWRQGAGKDVHVDACVLFSPGFSLHYRTWLTETDLLPLLRERTPLGVFCYSKLDGLEDLHFLPLLGLEIAPQELTLNPWHLDNGDKGPGGAFAQFFWPLQVTKTAFSLNFDSPAVKDFEDLQNYTEPEYREYGADQSMERLGERREVMGLKDERPDAIIFLPRDQGILESTREVGDLLEDGFAPIQPPLVLSEEQLQARPDNMQVEERILWALRLHRDWVAPRLQERDDGEVGFGSLFEGLTPESLNEGMQALFKQATGKDLGNPSEFLDQIRMSGGVPIHPCWYDLLSSIGWELEDYEDEPERLEPAFWTQASKRGVEFPVICETYAFMPDDKKDKLASKALKEVAGEYPDGALLLFKSMPYQEVQGHKYHFGGMLWWDGKWKPFALNGKMNCVDDVIDQVEAAFSFDKVDPRYADDDCSLAVPFNRMCQGLDANEPTGMMGLRASKWVTLMPA